MIINTTQRRAIILYVQRRAIILHVYRRTIILHVYRRTIILYVYRRDIIKNKHGLSYLLLAFSFIYLYVLKNQKPFFLNQRVSLVSVYNLKWREKFQISRLFIPDSDWLNFIHFSGYKYKIKLVSRLRKSINLDIHHS